LLQHLKSFRALNPKLCEGDDQGYISELLLSKQIWESPNCVFISKNVNNNSLSIQSISRNSAQQQKEISNNDQLIIIPENDANVSSQQENNETGVVILLDTLPSSNQQSISSSSATNVDNIVRSEQQHHKPILPPPPSTQMDVLDIDLLSPFEIESEFNVVKPNTTLKSQVLSPQQEKAVFEMKEQIKKQLRENQTIEEEKAEKDSYIDFDENLLNDYDDYEY
jgi:hypothetical protein